MSNKIRITVGGIDYIISSTDDETYVRRIGEEVNAKLDSLSRNSPYLSTTMAAVMAALDYCDSAKKANERCEQAKTELKSVSEELACARLEIDGARREIERLNRENRQLRIGNSAL
ncbi:MAG: cell division protein ZapA [Ruminococcaceae bacterium]|nr:cell division protein ZapA [Oscillospiraceae bacterium]